MEQHKIFKKFKFEYAEIRDNKRIVLYLNKINIKKF